MRNIWRYFTSSTICLLGRLRRQCGWFSYLLMNLQHHLLNLLDRAAPALFDMISASLVGSIKQVFFSFDCSVQLYKVVGNLLRECLPLPLSLLGLIKGILPAHVYFVVCKSLLILKGYSLMSLSKHTEINWNLYRSVSSPFVLWRTFSQKMSTFDIEIPRRAFWLLSHQILNWSKTSRQAQDY